MLCSIARIPIVLAAVVLWLPLHSVATATFTDIIVFGDSLSDTGNLDFFWPKLFIDIGPTGSFSEGIVWNEYLADDLGLSRAEPSDDGGTNYAVGGARTDSTGSADAVLFRSTGIAAQVADFIGSLPPAGADPDALYVVWGGGNDMRDATSVSEAAQAVANLEQHVRDLVTEGAHYVLFPNLPNLGRIPESIAAGQATIDLKESLSLAFNDELSMAADRLENDLTVELYRLDVFTAMEALTRDGEAFGFTNVTVPCGNVDGPCEGDLFWDEIHPTTAGHEFLGHAARSLLLGSPLGDLSGDGMINLGDVPAMILALTDRAGYDTAYPTIDADIAGDIDNSGAFDLGDLRPFAALFEPPVATAQAVPEPSALLMTIIALVFFCNRRAVRCLAGSLAIRV